MFREECGLNKCGGDRRTVGSHRRATIAAGLLVGMLLIGCSAASAAHIVEFQLDSGKLLQLVEHRLLEEDICALSSFELPSQSGQFILDHLEFPGPIEFQRDGQQIQIMVPVEIYTKTVACIYDPNCGPADYTPSSPLAPDLVLNLTAQLDEDGKLELCVEFNSLMLGSTEINLNSLDPNLADSLGGLLAPKCSKINVMKSLKKLLDGDRTVKQVGLSADANFNRIAVRLELDDPANPNAAPASSWSSFLNGQIGPSAGGMEWSIFMNQELLKQALVARFAASISEEEDIEITDGPHATYSAFGAGGARVELTMELEVDADCPFNDITVDPAIVTLDLFANGSKPNVIQSHGTLFTDVDDGDVVLCAFSFGPFGVIGLPVFAAIAAGEGPEADDYPSKCHQISDEEFDCEQPVTLPVIRLSKWNAWFASRADLTMDQLHGHSSGIIMGGPCDVTIGLPPNPKKLLAVGDGSFTYGVQGGCNSLHLGWSGYLTIEGDGRMCGVWVINDPKGVYSASFDGWSQALGSDWIGDIGGIALQFPLDGSDFDGFKANPYPCRLVIRTSVGSQCVEVAPPDVEIDPGVAAGLLTLAKANCLKPFWFSMQVMELLWLPDPPPFDVSIYTRLEDPFVHTNDVTAQLTNVALNFSQPAQMDQTGDDIQFNGVTMNLTADIAVNMRGIADGVSNAAQNSAPTFTPTFVGAAASMKQADEDAASSSSEMLMLTIEQPIHIDLSGQMMGEGSAELRFARSISQVVNVPPDQLPEGFAELSFVLDIPLEQVVLQTQMQQMDYSGSINALDRACGEGACGVGAAGPFPLTAFGWFGMKGRARRRSRRR